MNFMAKKSSASVIKILVLLIFSFAASISLAQDTLTRGDTTIYEWKLRTGEVYFQEFYVNGEEVFWREWYTFKKSEDFGYDQFPADYSKKQPYYTREYYGDSTLKVEGFHYKRKPEGLVKTYYPNGAKQCVCEFQKGKFHGMSRLHYDNNQVEVVGKYINGMEDSVHRYFHKNGNPWLTLTFDNGRLLDFSENLDSNGNARDIGTIDKKSMTGWLNYYDYDGSLLFREYYRKGRRRYSTRISRSKKKAMRSRRNMV